MVFRVGHVFTLGLTALLLLGHAGPAAAEPAVDDFVARLEATIGSVTPGDAAGARAACARLVRQVFDLEAMAPVTSAGTWAKMSAVQKEAYRDGLAGRAARDCASRRNEFAGQPLRLAGVRDGKGGDRYIAVRAVREEGSGRTLIWQVRGDAAGRLRAVDLTVNGRSLALAAQRDAKAVLQNGGGDLQALIRSLGD